MVNSITSSPSDSTPVSRSDSGPAAAGGASAAQRAGAGSWLRAEFLYLAILITQLPAALGYLKRVWGSGHYQFAVLLIPIAIWLMTSRLESVPRATTRSMPVLMLGLLGLIVTMVLSTFIAPMFWILFLLVLILTYVYDGFGWRGVRAILPFWVCLLVAVPLPRGIDGVLISKMQIMASQLASAMLDAVGVVHFRQGVILMTASDQFLTEEACSGVRSLFASLGAVALYCAFMAYPIWRFAFNLVQTLGWVLVGNSIRIAIVVLAAEWGYKSLASGWQHDVLGMLAFGLILGLVVSGDRLVQAFLPRRHVPGADTSGTRSGETGFKFSQFPPTGVKRGLMLMTLAIALFLGFCSVRLMMAPELSYLRNPMFKLPPFPVSEETDLPQEINGWELEHFEPIYRGDEVVLAANSYTWTYAKNEMQVIVSVDGPWEFWHDITACYRGTGWTADTSHRFSLADSSNPPSGPLNHSRIKISKPDGEQGLVFFAQHDMRGQEVRPNMLGGTISWELIRLNFLNSVRRVFGIRGKLNQGFQAHKLPLCTIQVVGRNTEAWNAEQIDQAEQFYYQVRRLLVNTSRFEKVE